MIFWIPLLVDNPTKLETFEGTNGHNHLSISCEVFVSTTVAEVPSAFQYCPVAKW